MALERRSPGATETVARPILVQKYGGSSLATPRRIKRVAERIAKSQRTGYDVVAVVSAMGETTDRLLALASRVARDPAARELDLLLSTGEGVSAPLVSMALNELGIPAVSLLGFQAGIQTDRRHARARILGMTPARIERDYGFADWEPPDAGGDTKAEHFGGGNVGASGEGWDEDYTRQMESWFAREELPEPFCLIFSLVNPHDLGMRP